MKQNDRLVIQGKNAALKNITIGPNEQSNREFHNGLQIVGPHKYGRDTHNVRGTN